jgi:CheY-like chemotaxis protein
MTTKYVPHRSDPLHGNGAEGAQVDALFQYKRNAVDVLVVDDDEEVLSSAGEILRLSGYSTAEARDGSAALALMRHTDVGTLVLDMRMPSLDGIGLLDALDNPPPVIVVSGYSLEPEQRRRLETSVCWYLQKPLQPRTLLEAVGRALDRQLI